MTVQQVESSGIGRGGPGRLFWNAIRPFALPASLMPAAFGAMLAIAPAGGRLHLARLLWTLLGVALLHSGANVLNDVVDFRRGVDRAPKPGAGAVVRGWLAPRTALWLAAVLLSGGIAVGLGLVWVAGLPVLLLGMVGLLIAVAYSAGPLPLKFAGLGDLAIFLNFGVLTALGAWLVQTGRWAWLPVLWSTPLALLAVAILNANNWRDRRDDAASGAKTMSARLGERGSRRYYIFLVCAPFVLVPGFLLVDRLQPDGPVMPWTLLVVLGAWPAAMMLIRRARKGRAEDLADLDARTARLNLLVGLLCLIGLVLGRWSTSAWR